MGAESFTGRTRKRKTSWKVLAADRTARTLITLGGLGTIFAVTLVCLFLGWVVVPLFFPPSVEAAGAARLEGEGGRAPPVLARVDDYRVLGWTLRADGTVDLFRADSGRLLDRRTPPGDARPAAVAFVPGEGRVALGYPDGTVRMGRLGFRTEFLEGEGLPPEVAGLAEGALAEHGGGIVERTPEGQLRRQCLRYEFEEPFDLGAGSGIERLDLTTRGSAPRVLAWTADGTLRVKEIAEKRNLLTGKVRYEVSGGDLKVPDAEGRGAPRWLLLSGVGTTAYAAWGDGHLVRFDTRTVEAPAVAERIDLVGPGESLTALGFLIGKTTLLAGDSRGRVSAWFTVRPERGGTVDGSVLVRARVLEGPAAPVTALAASERTRLLAAGYGDGSVRLFHVTGDRRIGEGAGPGGDPVHAVAITPKEDGIVAVSDRGISRWEVDAPHPEVTLHAIFGKVWYEGATGPEHVWQSSSGTDDFEPKYGLVPLIFGTVKATLYSMLFAVPLALLAAIFTTEFLRPEVRARVKPAIELMASLPSVVLGFLAGLVFAPFVESRVPEVVVGFGTVPFTVVLGAYLWQLLPRTAAARLERWRLPLAGAAAVPGVLLALVLGPVAEDVLFAGDVKSWLDGRRGTGTGGWFVLLLPVSAAAVIALNARFLNPRMAAAAARRGRTAEARLEVLRFAASAAASLALAFVAAGALSALGFDPRGSVVDTYVQRNALVVGIVMGFAVIPIVYTLSEDALAAVPEHLRAASLAVGATRWQTAISVILPTAASGLFSACMIGLGRAVGETMIVLMAAGNTPVLEWNVFNGFRTLSANIAVELPEAVRDSTAYRMLFLAALALFAMTFVLNTAAEFVRQRFRKRAYEL